MGQGAIAYLQDLRSYTVYSSHGALRYANTPYK